MTAYVFGGIIALGATAICVMVSYPWEVRHRAKRNGTWRKR